MCLTHEDVDKPCIQDIDSDFLSSCLDGSNLFIGDRAPKVIIRHMPKTGFSDEQTRFGTKGIDMFFQLQGCQICLDVKAYDPTISQSVRAVALFGELLTTASSLSGANRGINFVKPKVL